jgi:hypothetical protein
MHAGSDKDGVQLFFGGAAFGANTEMVDAAVTGWFGNSRIKKAEP